jgi:hypothetical protein
MLDQQMRADPLKRKTEAHLEDTELWSVLGMIDAARGNSPEAIWEAQPAISVNIPVGKSHGELKLDPAWDQIRKDPRFDLLQCLEATNHLRRFVH